MKKIAIFISISLLLFVGSCTDLDEKYYDKLTPNDYGQTPAEMESIITNAYVTLRGTDYNYPTEWIWFVGETSSDEAVIPTRGKDWFDQGVHQEMQMHTWTPANSHLEKSWAYLYSGVSKVNIIISTIEKSSMADNAKKNVLAELRGVRSFYYWWLCDLFGNVPLEIDYTDTTLKTNAPRKEVFEFVEKELVEIIPFLPKEGYGRFTQNAGNALLARLYLNAEVYSGTAQWQKCIDACDKVSGVDLEPNFFTNFQVANEVSKENIFVIPYDTKVTLGNYQIYLSLNYSSGASSPGEKAGTNGVNGICAEPGIYSKFDPSDIRRESMIIGPQVSKFTGKVVVDYTEAVIDWKNALVNEGARYYKYKIEAGELWERSNDYVLIRYSEVLLAKAEALVRLGQASLARPIIEKIRMRAGLTTTPATIDLNVVYDELLFEFLWENHRRTDNIRFGKFATSGIDVVAGGDKHLEIFPIPAKVLELNTKLKQNPGY